MKQVWHSSRGFGMVRLNEHNQLEIVYGAFSEVPHRLSCGRVEYQSPSQYPPYLKRLVVKVFADLWDQKQPASNDHMPLFVHAPYRKSKSMVW